MNIYIVTGGKGGTGKTLFAVTLATFFLGNNKFLAIDLNLRNPDFSRQLSRLKGAKLEHPLKIIGTGEAIRSFQLTEIFDDNESKIIGHSIRSDPPYKLPEYGINSLYRYIDIMLKSFHERYNIYPDDIVIDTDLSINNFIPDINLSPLLSISDVEFIRNSKIFFCHQWEPSFPFNREKIQDFTSSENNLSQIFNSSCKLKVIHCLNPKLFIATDDDAYLGSVKKIIDKNTICDVLTHEKLNLLNLLLSQIDNLENNNDIEIFECLIQSILEISNNKFANLILISCIIRRLFKYIELESKKEVTFTNLKKELEPLRSEIIKQLIFFKTCDESGKR